MLYNKYFNLYVEFYDKINAKKKKKCQFNTKIINARILDFSFSMLVR